MVIPKVKGDHFKSIMKSIMINYYRLSRADDILDLLEMRRDAWGPLTTRRACVSARDAISVCSRDVANHMWVPEQRGYSVSQRWRPWRMMNPLLVRQRLALKRESSRELLWKLTETSISRKRSFGMRWSVIIKHYCT